MKKQNLKTLAGAITDYAIAKQLTLQVIGGITDPNDDNDSPDDPPKDTGDLGNNTNDPRNDQAPQGTNTSSRG